jgi:hypothetical protein
MHPCNGKAAIMKMFKLGALAVAFAVMLLAASSAQATIMINADQIGPDVVFSYAGSINLSSVSGGVPTSGSAGGSINPSLANLSFAPGPITLFDLPSFLGPGTFGPGMFTSAAVSTGQAFLFLGPFVSPAIGLPSGYVTMTPLTGSMTFNSATLASLGANPGTYVSTWGPAGGINDSITLQIGSAPVPDTGSTMLLMGIGLAGLGFLRRQIFA